ncbi:hypothetical protein QQS21_009395 [Conoideocrella luteorostrata]|uniref:Uncharacterized protein n=1 Tax=Conoideocrella luteorostrata TaxID=1105319 RepID=A0AAJ0CHA2_9HYPO|nr:hypothetical protein QQS21_009395 [Conoideocrella luteorostrata]
MHFTTVATGIFCLANVAIAQPTPNSPADACCCCDIARSVISCTRSIMKEDCVCVAVACPADAKTVWDDESDAGRMSILPVKEEGRMTILPVKDEGVMTILPVKEEGRMTILPVKEEGVMTILPVKEEGIMSILPVKEEGRMSILPVNEGVMSILPVKEEGRMSILPVNEGVMSILPVKEEGRMSILPVNEEGRMTIMPVKETGRMTIMPVEETGKMTIMAAQPTGAPKALEKKAATDDVKNACCCCDLRIQAISCSRTLKKNECMCAAVQCPKNAPVVWEDGTPVTKENVNKPTVVNELPKSFITKTKRTKKDAQITAMPVHQ